MRTSATAACDLQTLGVPMSPSTFREMTAAKTNVEVPVPAPTADEHVNEVLMTWRTLHDRLHELLSSHMPSPFAESLGEILDLACSLTNAKTDESLFVLVQMLSDTRLSYSATHALLATSICNLTAPLVQLPPDVQSDLGKAALTMNIAMNRLQDALRFQRAPLSSDQRAAILTHPRRSVDLLRELGVAQERWLNIVLGHHETAPPPNADGLRGIEVATRILQIADVFVGRISPRSYRSGLPPQRALRSLYLGRNAQPDWLTAVLAKVLGLHIPGSYVRLESGEVAIVVRRGSLAHTPVVACLQGSRGAPLPRPIMRDTASPQHKVATSVPAESVRVKFHLASLLNAVQ